MTKRATVRLVFGTSNEDVKAIAAATVQAGGFAESVPVVPEIGDTMPDGTIYAGISPDTNERIYTTRADAFVPRAFAQANECAQFNAHGHPDWRLPTKNELNVLFNNRATLGGFDQTGAYPASWYWSSSRIDERSYSVEAPSAWIQRFSDGGGTYNHEHNRASVRCVRSENKQSAS